VRLPYKALIEIIALSRTLKKCSADVLAYVDRPHTSNGPTKAINGRLEHLRGSALGFRNLTNYIARSPRDAGAFRPPTAPWIPKSRDRQTTGR
jgi:transposase